MAHILVYLERTPDGLHPASAAGLCIARDIGSNRGATVTAVAPGDAGPLDAGVARAAGRFGADVLMFFARGGLDDLVSRLRPVHLLTPWTLEGLSAVQDLSLGPAIPRWIDEARPPGAGADTVTGLVAGTLPWHAFDQALEPEYLGRVDEVPLASWVRGRSTEVEAGDAPGFAMVPERPLQFVAPEGMDGEVMRKLEQLGASRVGPTELADIAVGTTVLWFQPGAGPLGDELAARPPGCRAMVFPGPDAVFDPSWTHADLVVPGAWPEAVARLLEPLWRAALA